MSASSGLQSRMLGRPCTCIEQYIPEQYILDGALACTFIKQFCFKLINLSGKLFLVGTWVFLVI